MISACERLAWREAEGTPFVGMPNLLAALGGGACATFNRLRATNSANYKELTLTRQEVGHDPRVY